MKEKYFERKFFENLKFNGEVFRNFHFEDCTFKGCNFDECELTQCFFSDCFFDKCVITNLKVSGNSQIQFCTFSNCQLIGINWNELLPSGRFADPIKKFQNCCLKYNTFTNINFRKFVFSENEISHSMFAECPLVEAKFKRCNLDKTEFLHCDIQKADFREAIGYQVDIMTCKMKNAKFSFPEAVNLLNALGVKID